MQRLLINPRGSLLSIVVAGVVLLGVGCAGESDSDEDARDKTMRPIGKFPGVADPKFAFPTEVQSDDESLNAFIRAFGAVCVSGEYEQYRLKVRRSSDPMSREAFQNGWHNVEEIRIRAIVSLPGSAETPAPRYAVLANIRMRAGAKVAEKNLVTQVLREQGKWVIDVLPGDELEALLAATSQPASAPATAPAQAPTP